MWESVLFSFFFLFLYIFREYKNATTSNIPPTRPGNKPTNIEIEDNFCLDLAAETGVITEVVNDAEDVVDSVVGKVVDGVVIERVVGCAEIKLIDAVVLFGGLIIRGRNKLGTED